MSVTMEDLMGMAMMGGQQQGGGGLARQIGGQPQRQIQTTYNPSQARQDTDSGADNITRLQNLLEEAKMQNALLAEEDKRLDLLYPTEGLETSEQTQSRVALRDLLGTQGLQEKVSSGMSLDPETGEYRPTYTVQPSGMMGPSKFEGMTTTQKRQALANMGRPDLIKLLVPEGRAVKPQSTIGKEIADLRVAEETGDIEAVKLIKDKITKAAKAEKISDVSREYRQHLSMAIRGAFKGISFNKEQQTLLDIMGEDPNTSETVRRELERSMTPEQLEAFRVNVDDYFTRYTPDSILKEYQSIRSREDVSGVEEAGEIELPEGVTMEDVKFTAQKHGITIQEVIERLQ